MRKRQMRCRLGLLRTKDGAGARRRRRAVAAAMASSKVPANTNEFTNPRAHWQTRLGPVCEPQNCLAQPPV